MFIYQTLTAFLDRIQGIHSSYLVVKYYIACSRIAFTNLVPSSLGVHSVTNTLQTCSSAQTVHTHMCQCVLHVRMCDQAYVHIRMLARCCTPFPTSATEEGRCSLQDVVGSHIVLFQQVHDGLGIATKASESTRADLAVGIEGLCSLHHTSRDSKN